MNKNSTKISLACGVFLLVCFVVVKEIERQKRVQAFVDDWNGMVRDTEAVGRAAQYGGTAKEHREKLNPIAWEDMWERNARARELEERKKAKEVALAWKTESKSISISDFVVIELQSVPGNLWFGKYEVTQKQWVAVMGNNPSWFKNPDSPVENVSWKDCQKFLEKLNEMPSVKKVGLTFRLPTEEEWKLACRAGSMSDYCRLEDETEITANTLDQVAWFNDNSDKQTHPVGQKKPNAFGLYDMHGNVREWNTTAGGDGGGHSGGSWGGSTDICAASKRLLSSPSYRSYGIGFRLCADGKAD
ncbi:MAG: formylglycine-generating enzyme family protein [Kiritimatiellae bacterium]|nr:formylglycine-generating enzyme family protein [Kiritimatiellia bacterium]